MKKVVIFDEYNEIDFKPSNLLHRYFQLAEKDILRFFIKGQRMINTVCPGCRGKKSISSFKKFGLNYVECANCRSVYVTPRPDDISLQEFYTRSEARKFWHEELSKATKSKRKEKIIKPRIQWIVDSTQEYLPDSEHIVDINTNQYGYVEELLENKFFRKKTLINLFLPFNDLEFAPGINVINIPSWKVSLEERVDVVTIFEVINHMADVDMLFEKIHGMLKDKGLCFITVILISGFDLQILWDKSENLFPPDRLNVFSVEGLYSLFDRFGFECLEFSTPGILDVEIVTNAIKKNPEIKFPRFVEYLLQNRSDDVKRSFQEFLQEGRLSSYGRILIRKK